MFPVHHYDPRKEDREANRKRTAEHTLSPKKGTSSSVTTTSKKKRSSLVRSTTTVCHDESVSNRRKKKIKRRNGDQHADDYHLPKAQDEEPSISRLGGETTLLSLGDDCQSSSSDDDNDAAGDLCTKSTLQVIAPETDGAVSSSRRNQSRSAKPFSNKISEEAFDDLDLPDESWLLRDGEEINDGEVDDHDDDGGGGGGSKDKEIASFDPTDEIQRALHMSQLPILEASKRWGLADFLVRNLQRDGYDHFFPIQALVIPDVLVAEQYMGALQARDVACAAPTGSGKTLAFVLPVLNALAASRILVRRLRALVILPSRDLAQQVYNVFQKYSEGSNLKIGLAIGQTDFHSEQKDLILGPLKQKGPGTGGNVSRRGDYNNQYHNQRQHRAKLCHWMDPGNLSLALDAMRAEVEHGGSGDDGTKNESVIPLGGLSAVDVLVCTPGRLVDHMDNTPGFTLQHLRWLVIDEADRLLSQSYHGWIQRVLDSVHTPVLAIDPNNEESWKHIDPVTFRRSARDATTAGVAPSSATSEPSSSLVCQRIQLRKLLYSATLTKDPQKLSSLRLVNPKFFNAHHLRRDSTTRGTGNDLEGSLYSIPPQLQEYTVECTAEQKPLVLLALLLERVQEGSSTSSPVTATAHSQKKESKNMIVVFTSSLESTHRLTRLLQLLWQAFSYGSPPMEYSSALNQSQRSQLMYRCNDPNDHSVQVLVCSDGMSRGMDLASVGAVIHYDVPGMAKTYVHRCGRTARAGQEGHAIVLLKGAGQVGQFTRLRRLISRPEAVQRAPVKTSLIREAIPLYRECVSRRLKQVLAAESTGELKPTDTDLTRWLPGRQSSSSDSGSGGGSDVGDDSSTSSDGGS